MSPLFEAGLNVTAIGLGVVFVLLTLLVYIIRGMSALSHWIEGRGPDAPSSSMAAPVPSSSPSPSPSSQELIGVIGAAVAAHRRRHQIPNRKD
jgi:sodium pump decarboxylase gamma subunit